MGSYQLAFSVQQSVPKCNGLKQQPFYLYSDSVGWTVGPAQLFVCFFLLVLTGLTSGQLPVSETAVSRAHCLG